MVGGQWMAHSQQIASYPSAWEHKAFSQCSLSELDNGQSSMAGPQAAAGSSGLMSREGTECLGVDGGPDGDWVVKGKGLEPGLDSSNGSGVGEQPHHQSIRTAAEQVVGSPARNNRCQKLVCACVCVCVHMPPTAQLCESYRRERECSQ